MAQINFRSLISTQSGVGATTGKETAQFFNENFKITKENLEAIWSILETVVSSSNIEGIRINPVQDPENPDSVLYTLFEYNIDGDFENGNWFPIQVLFENLVGDIQQNPQLKQMFDSLTPLSRFIPVESQVGINTSAISQNTSNIEDLQESDINQDKQISELQKTTKQHDETLRTKANQVLEMFDIVAKGSGYKVGTTIMDQTSNYILEIEAVDANGGILSVLLSQDEEAIPYYINIVNGGQGYAIGDVIATDNAAYNALVTLVDANGAILNADLTTDEVTETFGQNANLALDSGTGALVSVTTYPTIYLQVVSEAGKNRIQYYINGDLTTPYDFVAYPKFMNIQEIVSEETDTYYSLSYSADSENAMGYEVGDTFNIDGTPYTGQITDISTIPYTITTDIPFTVTDDMEGDYTTTATSGTGVGLHVTVKSTFHPQTTTNTEFNTYMENHDLYIMDLINAAVAEAVYNLTAMINKKVDQVDFDTHLNDFSNPHHVTKEQVGLGNVDNTSDMDKPISSAVQTELNDIKSDFANIKKIQIISTKYYDYLASIGELDSNVLYNVGNYNTTYVNESELDETAITSAYASGDRLAINGTDWQVIILDATVTPMTYTDNISDFTEFDISGTYSLTPITGSGAGLQLKVTSTEW
jgi:hypothetical protein